MASRSRAGGVGIQAFLNEAEHGLADLDEHSPKDVVTATMDREGKRLDDFVVSAILAAEEIVNTGLVPNLKSDSSYFPPPLAQPVIKLRPDDDYFKQWFKRRADKEITQHPAFQLDEIVPKKGHSAAIEIEASVYTPSTSRNQLKFDVEFEVNYEDTITAFKWLLQEWRRPVGQLLRGLPNLELWENGRPIDAPKDQRTKDPAILLQHYLAQPKPSGLNVNLFSLRSSFSAEDIDQDVVITFAVFLCFFDAVYRLTTERSDPDRLVRHYHTLMEHLPKAPFRVTTIFQKE